MVGIWVFPSEKLSWLNSSISITLDGFTLKYYGSGYASSQFNEKDLNYYYFALA